MALELLPMPVLSRDELVDLANALASGAEPSEASRTALAAVGLTRLDVWSRLAAVAVDLLGPEVAVGLLLPELVKLSAESPDPDLAAVGLARFQDLLGGPVLLRQMLDDPRFAAELTFLLGFGTVTVSTLLREPGLTDLLLTGSTTAARPREALVDEAVGLTSRLGQASTRRNALRRWKRGEFLRIIYRDFVLRRPLPGICEEISDVADACCEAALLAAVRTVIGPTATVDGVAVIAMGKWGSRELNYNSDIDLMVVYDPSRTSQPAGVWEDVVRELTAELGEKTDEGLVFPVDLRLRPDGNSGSLARSLEGYAAYYQTASESWEAQALTRARCCAGDPVTGRHFMALADRTAYGTRVTHAGIQRIRANRRKLDARSDAERNVKEGRGGIRDIEFTVQLLQLTRGVTDPSVRGGSTWQALDALATAGAVTEPERLRLHEAYTFLRQTEHLLQLQPAAPTKELPANPAGLRRIARALGLRDSGPLRAEDRFLDQYRSHTNAARSLCEQLFFNPIPLTSPDAGERVVELLDPAIEHDEAGRLLDGIGFTDPAEARRRLIFLGHGQPPMRLPAEVTGLFVELLPVLLGCVQRMPDPDAALRWFERFIANAGGRHVFYQFLLEHPPVMEVLCRIGGYSELLSQTIVSHPEYLDRVIDSRFVGANPNRADLLEQLTERLQPLKKAEHRLDDIRRFRQREQFRVGVRDIVEDLDVAFVTSQLSDIADATVEALLAELRQEAGVGSSLQFAVLGCGKLGGRELHYSSDLDVLFVYDGDPAAAELLASRLISEGRRRSRAGSLYELDARLRPYGINSPLTRTLASYRAYYEQTAEAWERLAMSRIRHVAGDQAVGEALCDLAREFVFRAPPTDQEMDALRHIKRRIETERLKPDPTHLDIKVAPGGILDIEFLAQILRLQHADRLSPAALATAHTPTMLTELANANLLRAGQAELLLRSYRWYRRLETRLQLVMERSSGLLPLDDEGLARAAKRVGWNRVEADRRPHQLADDLLARMRAVREIYETEIGVAP